MTLIRPELKAALWRWREVLAGAAVLALGLWLMSRALGPVLYWFAIAVVVLGALLMLAGLQRGRFRIGAGGPGVVQIIEGRVGYFGPLEGGWADIDELTSLELDHSARPTHWVLSQPEQPPLHIPVTAEGADALFDAFQRLPELDTPRMLRQLQNPSAGKQTVWRRAGQEAQLSLLN